MSFAVAQVRLLVAQPLLTGKAYRRPLPHYIYTFIYISGTGEFRLWPTGRSHSIRVRGGYQPGQITIWPVCFCHTSFCPAWWRRTTPQPDDIHDTYTRSSSRGHWYSFWWAILQGYV